MAIFTCGACHQLHEMGDDHPANEPCVKCWDEGWRVDAAGNVTRFYCRDRVLFSKPTCKAPCRVCTALDRTP